MGTMVRITICENFAQAIYHYYCKVTSKRDFPVTSDNPGDILTCKQTTDCPFYTKKEILTERVVKR
jgi:hypothetical protein